VTRPTTDPEFQGAIPPLAEEERRNLEESIIRDGCRDALVVWAEEGLLLDGHNRLTLCEQHGIPYAVKEISLPDRDAALDWIDVNQLGRRNLSPDNFKLVLGRVYNRRKKSRQEIAEAASQAAWDKKYASGTVPAPCTENQSKDANKPRLAGRIGAQFGVGRDTVQKAGKLAEAFDEVRQENPAASHEEAMQQAKEAARAARPPRAPQPNRPLTGDDRANRIRELAAEGHNTGDIAGQLGHTREFIQKIARDNDIRLHTGKGLRPIDHERVIRESVAAVDGVATGLQAFSADVTQIGATAAAELAEVLGEALKIITKLHRQLKEIAK
jgi:hypothetical protein